MDSTETTETTTKNAKSSDEKRIELGDLNDDCLIKMFADYCVDDLLSVVDYDNRIGNAARFIFKRNFADKVFTVTNEFDPHREKFSWSMKLLNYFGGVITKLRVEYKERYRQIDHKLDNLIVSKCSKSLKEIEFQNADLFTMDDINESFEEVRKVTFIQSKCGYLISKFGQLFPKAHTLHLNEHLCSTFEDRLILECHHPGLKQFSIKNTDAVSSVSEKKFNNSNISTFIKLNPQLEKLSIFCDNFPSPASMQNSVQLAIDSLYVFDGIKIDHELLGIIKSKLKNFKELKIRFGQNSLTIKQPTFHFDKLDSLSIEFEDSSMLNCFPISSDRIKELHLEGGSLRPNIIQFILLHKSLNVLELRGKWNSVVYGVSNGRQNQTTTYFVPEIISLTSQLPYLNELHISYQSPSFQPGQMFTLLGQCALLQKLVIYADDVQPEKKQEIINNLQAMSLVPNGWEIQFSDDWDNFHRYRLTFTKGTV